MKLIFVLVTLYLQIVTVKLLDIFNRDNEKVKASERQDVVNGNPNTGAFVAGTSLLLSLITASAIGKLIGQGFRNGYKDEKKDNKKKDDLYFDGCGYYFQNKKEKEKNKNKKDEKDKGKGDKGNQDSGKGNKGSGKTKSWFSFRRKRSPQYVLGIGTYPGVVCPPNYDYDYSVPWGIHYAYNGLGAGNQAGGNGGETDAGGNNNEGDDYSYDYENDESGKDGDDGDKESGNCETEEDDGDKDDSKADGKKKGGNGGCKKTKGVISNVLRGVSNFFG